MYNEQKENIVGSNDTCTNLSAFEKAFSGIMETSYLLDAARGKIFEGHQNKEGHNDYSFPVLETAIQGLVAEAYRFTSDVFDFIHSCEYLFEGDVPKTEANDTESKRISEGGLNYKVSNMLKELELAQVRVRQFCSSFYPHNEERESKSEELVISAHFLCTRLPHYVINLTNDIRTDLNRLMDILMYGDSVNSTKGGCGAIKLG
jgi:CRISPR/Cas system CSM-associated protein Csm2 small subunit